MKPWWPYQVIVVVSVVWRFCQGYGCGDVGFTPNSACSSKRSTSQSLKSFSNSSRADCATRCYFNKQCIVFFYSESTTICTIYGSPVSSLALTNEIGSKCYQAHNFVEYWVKTIVSSSYSESGFETSRLIGAYPGGHWHSSSSGANFVFEISEEIFVTGMMFYLLEGVGTVSGVSLWTPDGAWRSVFSASQPGTVSGARNFAPPLSETNFKTKRIRIVTSAQRFGMYAIKTFGKNSL